MFSLNDLLVALELGSLKGYLAALVLPPIPFIAMVLAGAAMLRRKRVVGGWTLVWIGCLLLYFSCTTLLGWALTQGLVRPPPALSSGAIAELKAASGAPKTAIVVLGAGSEEFAPEYGVSNLTRLSMERLRYGVWLSRATGLPLAFSGGVAYNTTAGASEAEIAARIAAAEFNRPLRWAEAQSRDTAENARYTVLLLRPAGIERLVIVTHGFHMRRAVAAFERAAQRSGVTMSLQPAPMGLAILSDGWLPSTEGFLQTRMALREWIGWFVGA